MSEKYQEWAIVDLFGHQRVAGRVSEQQIGGTSFVRVDVPRTMAAAPFTKLYGPGAIYSITITDEETAMAAARYCEAVPMDQWTIREMLTLPSPAVGDYEEVSDG